MRQVSFLQHGRGMMAAAVVIVLGVQLWQLNRIGKTTVLPNSLIDTVPQHTHSYRRRFRAANTTNRRRTRQRHPLLDSTNNSSKKSIAMLIAGQCHRFIYRDQSGPLFRFGNTLLPPDYYHVDVYIALQCGQIMPSYIDTVETPPYMVRKNDTDIAAWFIRRGARSVTLQVIDTTFMDLMYHDISHQATTTVKHLQNFSMNEVPQWQAEARKFFMRHFVFGMALEGMTDMAQTKLDNDGTSNGTRQQQHPLPPYDAYIFNREDNFYLNPLDLETNFFQNQTERESATTTATSDTTSGTTSTPTTTPFVIVDKYCQWGAYSDKMYIANHEGAALLFSSTKAEFMSFMKRLLLIGLFQKRHGFHRPWQAESFVQDTLQGIARVEQVDLQRMDVRYNGGVKCVPNLYFYCMSKETQLLSRRRNLMTCRDLAKRRHGRDWIFFDRLPSF